ncbi:MAG: 3-phosphoshikimate 1-carboxyvinyltransferase [Ruminococcaceae bacterium]|nr:3-phosphoshikimate 1-carboxyvinyltransferase [Oscillospiraceae bacterium]
MRIRITPSRAEGCVTAPPSKSMAHRLLISAALAKGKSVLLGVSLCEDVLATLDCLSALGIGCERAGDTVTVTGGLVKDFPSATLACRESGSTIRFFLPIALLSSHKCTLTGAPSLMRRPMRVYEALCREHGLYYAAGEQGITVRGPLQSGVYSLPGNISSQFISGMLFALSQTEGESRLCILPPVESRSYIDLTVSALRSFGADVVWLDQTTLRINGSAAMTARDATVEGDYSNAAFLEAFNLFGGNVRVEGLDPASGQGDRVYRDCFARLAKGYACISLENCPDLAPILFSVAAAMHGARFEDTARLKIKESDRAAVMAEELSKLGATVRVYDNAVEVEKSELYAPKEPICGHNDHRIVMSLSVLLSVFGGEIEGAEAVAKSFPDFFDKISALGVRVEKI